MAPSDSIIAPFRGIRYQTGSFRDLSSLIAPPYDVITLEMRVALYARDEHNFVRVELPQDESAKSKEGDRYSRAAATLHFWLAQGVLIQEEKPAFYVLEQEFQVEGKWWRRRGVFAALRLPEKGRSYVLPHEGTLAAPKADRLRLMQACEMMTSPILVMSEDSESGLLSQLLEVSSEPSAVAVDDDDVVHRLWVVQGQDSLEAICSAVGPGPLYIADGHHRFETAMTYRDNRRKSSPAAPANAGFNYALTLVTSAQDPALKILPTHRIISGLGKTGRRLMLERMQQEFYVREAAFSSSKAPPILRLLEEAAGGRQEFIAYYSDRHWYILAARNEDLGSSPLAAASFDISLLHQYLIDPVLASLGDGPKVTYVSDQEKAIGAVASGEADLAIFLRPVRVSEVLAAAGAGKQMPGKSTYFYPKAPAGLVVSDMSARPI